MAVAVLACTPLVLRLGQSALQRSQNRLGLARVYGFVTAVLPAVLLFLSFISLIGDSYNPFLYSQF